MVDSMSDAIIADPQAVIAKLFSMTLVKQDEVDQQMRSHMMAKTGAQIMAFQKPSTTLSPTSSNLIKYSSI